MENVNKQFIAEDDESKGYVNMMTLIISCISHGININRKCKSGSKRLITCIGVKLAVSGIAEKRIYYMDMKTLVYNYAFPRLTTIIQGCHLSLLQITCR